MPHKTKWSRELSKQSYKTNYLFDILTNSPTYWSGKLIGAINKNLNFDVEVHKRHNANFILGTP